jgi:y4mF family transcriptional regulator
MYNSDHEIATFVRDKRKQANLTQVELAAKAGVGLRFLRELENGKQALKTDKVNQVLRMFGCELGPIPLNRSKLIDETSKSNDA